MEKYKALLIENSIVFYAIGKMLAAFDSFKVAGGERIRTDIVIYYNENNQVKADVWGTGWNKLCVPPEEAIALFKKEIA